MSASSGCGLSVSPCQSGCVARASSAERRGGRGEKWFCGFGKDELLGRGMHVREPEMGNGCCLVSGRKLRNLGVG